MTKKFLDRIAYLRKGSFQLNRVSNLALNRIERKTRNKRLRSLPPIVDIVITKRCNSKCIMCIPYKSQGEKDMSFSTFRELAKRLFPTCYEVRFCSGGEPLLNSNFVSMLELCSSYKVVTRLLTNGMFLKENLAAEIVDMSSLSLLEFSMDGAKKITVEKIRIGISFDQVLKNIPI